MDLAIRVYDLSAKFPADERYGLISQIRRCAVSIPSNISEGAGRNSNKEFLQFLGIAMDHHMNCKLNWLLQNVLDLWILKYVMNYLKA